MFEDNDISALDNFRNAIRSGNRDEQFEKAKELFTSNSYRDALFSYEILQKMYPNDNGFCNFKIAECYLNLDEEEKAIDFFVDAYEVGYNKDLCDDAIWDASERACYKFREIDFIHRYSQKLPNGKYVRKSKEIIENFRK